MGHDPPSCQLLSSHSLQRDAPCILKMPSVGCLESSYSCPQHSHAVPAQTVRLGIRLPPASTQPQRHRLGMSHSTRSFDIQQRSPERGVRPSRSGALPSVGSNRVEAPPAMPNRRQPSALLYLGPHVRTRVDHEGGSPCSSTQSFKCSSSTSSSSVVAPPLAAGVVAGTGAVVVSHRVSPCSSCSNRVLASAARSALRASRKSM